MRKFFTECLNAVFFSQFALKCEILGAGLWNGEGNLQL